MDVKGNVEKDAEWAEVEPVVDGSRHAERSPETRPVAEGAEIPS